MSKTIFVAEAQLRRLTEDNYDYTSNVPEYNSSEIRVSEPITGEDGEVELKCGPDTDKYINMTCPDGFYGSRITRMV